MIPPWIQCRGVKKNGKRCKAKAQKWDIERAGGYPLCRIHKDQRPPWEYFGDPTGETDLNRPEPWKKMRLSQRPLTQSLLGSSLRAGGLYTALRRTIYAMKKESQ